MKISKCATIAALSLIPALAFATPGIHSVAGGSWIGCVSKDVHSKLTSYSVAGDKAAFRKAAVKALQNGDCTMLSTGESVQLTDTSVFSGMVKVRRVGDTDEYWTNIEAIK